MKGKIFFLVLVSVLFWMGPAAAEVIYSVDDGTAEGSVGYYPLILPPVLSTWWANGFTEQPDGDMITAVQIAFNSRDLSWWVFIKYGGEYPFKVMVYEDPDDDGDPRTGPIELLASADWNVSNPQTYNQEFLTIPVGPVKVSGKFFVAALLSYNPAEFKDPCAMDLTSGQGVSWYAGYQTDAVDLADPFNNPVPNQISDPLSSYPRNWLLRAVGVASPPPEPAAIPTLSEWGMIIFALLTMGTAVVFLRKRKKCFTTCRRHPENIKS